MAEELVVFSGIQPSGKLTLGNYLGALRNWGTLQEDYRCFFSLVDLHTITVRQDPSSFENTCYDALAIYLASGIDPSRSRIFLQSQVLAHGQLAWILGCYAHMGELSRMTQFKDKSQKPGVMVNVGLFTYPILMAADILLYETNLVPVGADQKQHLELARDLAIRFNSIYGSIFAVPEVYHPNLGARIMSLQEPQKKMSKSTDNPLASIFLLDSPDEIRDKFKRAVTDSSKEIYFDPIRKPGISNLLTILAAIMNKTMDVLIGEVSNHGYSSLKSLVADIVIEFLKPLQREYVELRRDRAYLRSVLMEGTDHASKTSQKTLDKVYSALGLVKS